MSQYPSIPPYQTPGGAAQYPTGYRGAYDDGLGPARAAGVMLFVVGGLGILGSLCLAVVGAMFQQLMAQPDFARGFGEASDMSTEFAKIIFLILAGLGVLFSVIVIVLGAFVRKGGMASTIIALILISLAELYCAFNMFYTFGKSREMNGSRLSGAICGAVVPTILFGVLIFLLIKSIAAIRAYRAAQYQQQAQMWQYQQMQQTYGQPGYGYPQQPAPPPPPPGSGNYPSSQM